MAVVVALHPLSPNAGLQRLLLGLVLILYLLVEPTAAQQPDNDNNEMTTTTTTASQDMVEVVVWAVVGSLLAILLNVLALVMAAYAWWEDILVRRYLHEGLLHHAVIQSMTPVGTDDYLVHLEYRPIPAVLTVVAHDVKGTTNTLYQKDVQRIFKQVRIPWRSVDGWTTDQVWTKSALEIPSSIDLGDAHAASNVSLSSSWSFSSSQPPPRQPLVGGTPSSSVAAAREHHLATESLDIFVIPGYPHSGMVRAQVERMRSGGYRLPSLVFVVFLLVCAGVSAYGAMVAIWGASYRHQQDLAWVKGVVLEVLLLLVEGALVLGCGGGRLLQQDLHRTYLFGQEESEEWNVVRSSVNGDTTTLSSKDDSYLRVA